MNLDELLNAFSAGPQQLEDSLAGLDEDQWDLAPIDGQWSFREVVCHLADYELINAERIKRVLAEDNPTLFEADPDKFHRAQSKQCRSVSEELNLIRVIRSHLQTILSSCDVEDFQRTGVHSTDGPLTLESLVERTTIHIPHHIQFIRDKRAVIDG